MSRTNDILVIGDVMLDQYVSGSTDRLSPEAPVPVVKIDSQFSVLGGAANVANNLAALGANVSLLGVVGRDDNARIVNELLEAKGIANQLLDEDIFTTVKTRVISRNQQMVRVDREEVFSDEDAFVNHLSGVLSFFQGSAIIVSDYAKGVCSPGAMKVILTWATNNDVKVLIDPKGTDWSKYEGAFLIKPNVKELEELFNTSIENTNSEIAQFGKEIRSRYNIEHVLITRSEEGMTHIHDEIFHVKSRKVDIYDLSGAGDTVIAVLVFLIQQGEDISIAINKANQAGSYVITKPNTYAISNTELNLLN
ncbi:PfkB family carbohydrate kinase [Saprospiraceae bacterium]|nr:PfkB family carbohydrate kinase [Saprospiraceae bacterium]MDA9299656.1 PfkB family carbohydrate kinase [Saprospiraceae bacterium]MDC1308646.1 PfkB family carbohydrate kinase [Saprospiraceae bacterium]